MQHWATRGAVLNCRACQISAGTDLKKVGVKPEKGCDAKVKPCYFSPLNGRTQRYQASDYHATYPTLHRYIDHRGIIRRSLVREQRYTPN